MFLKDLTLGPHFAVIFRCNLEMLKSVWKEPLYFKIFSVSRSARYWCPVASIHYILQAKPIACAVKGTCEIRVKIPWSENETVYAFR